MAPRANLSQAIDDELRLVAADVADVRDMIENPQDWPEANHRGATWEWPDVVARLERLSRQRAAGSFTAAQERAHDEILRSLDPVIPALRRMGLPTPRPSVFSTRPGDD